MEKNGTVMDYLRWRGDLTFAQDGFNEVDDLVLCIISYLNFRRFDDLRTTDPAKAVALPDVAARLTEEDEQLGLSELDYIPLMRLAAETARFREVRMFGFTHEWTRQRRCSSTPCPTCCRMTRCWCPSWAPTPRWWAGRRTST